MSHVTELVERYVEIYNQPGSPVYPLYADTVEWAEVPGGGRGGRAELFEALGTYRTSHTLHLETLGITAGSFDAALESYFTIAPRESPEEPIGRGHVLWFLRFDDAGLITVQHDYYIPEA